MRKVFQKKTVEQPKRKVSEVLFLLGRKTKGNTDEILELLNQEGESKIDELIEILAQVVANQQKHEILLQKILNSKQG
ncbi:hypothetical protein TH25_02460 [Thalassospira profundimaris]|uniref:Uncharacterized protein n=1 Tax=Thalassospira profundimaris TaxID=502049 RepID=A0A367XL85_9PROT|nr:hypothetical protein TH25_02460 [Thalassospira profundimaris]